MHQHAAGALQDVGARLEGIGAFAPVVADEDHDTALSDGVVEDLGR
jgi:hypothetical protein